MKDFILPPYEFPGADFDPKAHAETRLEVGGKKRNFVLKMRDGVIYFKEPSRSPMFAIPLFFAPELALDTIGLVSVWQREVAADNFGAFIDKCNYFRGLPVRGRFLVIVKSDGNGWMKEHFDDEWFLLPPSDTLRLYEIWNPSVLAAQCDDLLESVKHSLLQRTVSASTRQLDSPRWIGGSGEEFSSLLVAAAQLFLSPADYTSFLINDFKLNVKSCSAFAKGGFEGFWLRNACYNSNFVALWKVIQQEFDYVGVRWNEGGEQVDEQTGFSGQRRVERIFQTGIERWGEDWRGNWAPQRGTFVVPVPHLSSQSAHEKMEALLLLRDWLSGKMPDAQLESLLRGV